MKCKSNRVKATIIRLLDESSMTQQQLMERAKLHAATLSKIIGRTPRRLTELTLEACVKAWPDHEQGIELLIAHLRDEIERAGVAQANVSVLKGHGTTERAQDKELRATLEVLHEAASTSLTWKQMLTDLETIWFGYCQHPHDSDTGLDPK